MSITKELRTKATTINDVVSSGDVKAVELLKTQYRNLLTEVNKSIHTLDYAILAAQTGFHGDDFLKGVATVKDRSPKNTNGKRIIVEDASEFM